MKFQTYDVVRIVNTTDSNLDGQVCRVVGRSSEYPEVAFYIVSLQRAVIGSDGFIHEALNIISSCLEPV